MPILNTIIYGPPGTGKTYQLTQRALDIIGNVPEGEVPQVVFNNYLLQGRIEFTTFHQNYAYEDFVEGLQAKYDAGAVHYSIVPGVLKRIAYRALYAWLTGESPNLLLNEAQNDIIENYLNNGNIPPNNVNNAQIPNYVLIIDEINRGNVAKILGELITLVEDTKRARREGEIQAGHQPIFATLPYTREKFILPPNLYIIGTMNTADRSLIGLDAALRRRFTFEELAPQPDLLEGEIEGVNLSGFLTNLNQRIENIELTRDHCIGHAYFMGINDVAGLAAVMRQKVIPQLQEYFHDRPEELYDLLKVGDQSFVNERGQIDEDSLRVDALYNDFKAP
jgi:5-methylcytosine-specific restriction protein B